MNHSADRGKVTGWLFVTLNGGTHVLDVAGSVEDGVFYFQFNGATVHGKTSVTWAGEQKAAVD